MKTKHKIIMAIIIIVVIISIYSFIQRHNDNPKIWIISYVNKPITTGKGLKFVGVSFIPFFIIVNKQTPIVPDAPEGYISVVKHEKAHWKQFQKQGLIPLYFGLTKDIIKYGYKNSPYEIEARKAAGQPLELN